MLTIKDVAKAAQVSVATVSRVLNQDEKVTLKTREHVLQVIEKIGYTPNVLGRNLRVSATKRILVLLPTVSNQFFSAILKGIEEVARKHGYQVMMSATHNDAQVERDYIKLLYNKGVDGIILLSSELTGEELSENAAQYPIVMCSEYNEGARLSAVTIDNDQAGYDATQYLLRKGHTRVAILSNSAVYSARLRTKGYLEALREYKVAARPEYIVEVTYSFHSGQRACRKLLRLEEPPTAIFAISDELAAGVIKELHRQGLQAGKTIDVFGFDNTSLAKMMIPPISTVSQPRKAIGIKAMELLLEKMQDINSPNQMLFLPHRLVLRETTGSRETDGEES